MADDEGGTILPTLVIRAYEDPFVDYSYDDIWPENPFGPADYFHEHYIYNNGIAQETDFYRYLEHYQAGGPTIQYLSGFEWLDQIVATLRIPIATYYIAYPPRTAETNANTRLSGTPFTPFRALYHYFFGNSQSLSIDIQDVRINPEINNITQRYTSKTLSDIASDFSTGIHPIDIEFNYNTMSSGASIFLTLGNITLRLVGHMEVNADGSYSINGEIRSFDDIFDGGPAERGPFKEFLTSFIQNGQEYNIEIPGSIPVQFNSNQKFINEYNVTLNRSVVGNPLLHSILYMYNTYISQVSVIRTSQNNSTIYTDKEIIYLEHIDKVTFSDDYIDISYIPVTQSV